MKNYGNEQFTTGNYTTYFTELILNSEVFTELKDTKGNFLDIGCGSGMQIFSLAPHFINFEFTGIDISKPNIQLCNEQLLKLTNAARFNFVIDDFYKHNFNHDFDIIFSYSVFQLIDYPLAGILESVWDLLKPGGYFILSMPHVCLYNKYLNIFRKYLGGFRSRLFDCLCVNLAYLLYRCQYPKSFLNERMIYLDQVDTNLISTASIDDQRWQVIFQEKTPSPSFIQSRHLSIILRKKGV